MALSISLSPVTSVIVVFVVIVRHRIIIVIIVGHRRHRPSSFPMLWSSDGTEHRNTYQPAVKRGVAAGRSAYARSAGAATGGGGPQAPPTRISFLLSALLI
jgi:hypothetical protein